MSIDPIIEFKNVSKIFHSKIRKGFFSSENVSTHALSDVSFSVLKGEIFSLLGPNGAGKTTAIKIMTTLLLPTSGKIMVNGFDIERYPKKVKGSINAMLMGERSIYWKLTGRQNLEYFGTLYYQSKINIRRRIENLIAILKLGDIIDRPVETYSSGQKYKLAFAKTLINDPPIIFLDEPTATLDPRSAKEMRSFIKKINENGKTIFLTTHNMAEAHELSDRTAIIDLGKIIAMDDPDVLCHNLQSHVENSLSLTVNKVADSTLGALRTLSGVSNVITEQNSTTNKIKIKIFTSQESALPEIMNLLYKNQTKIIDFKTDSLSLEDVFLELTGRTLAIDTKIPI